MRLSFDQDNRPSINIQIPLNGNKELSKTISMENDSVMKQREERRQKLTQIFRKVARNIKISLMIQNLVKEQITSDNIAQKTMTQLNY